MCTMRSEVERHRSGHGCRVLRVGVGSDGSRTEHVRCTRRSTWKGRRGAKGIPWKDAGEPHQSHPQRCPRTDGREANNLRLSRLQRYSIPKRRSTRAPTAPSNSGSVQINAVAIRRSETTSQTPRSPEWAMGVGSIDIHAPRLMPRVIAARTNRKSRIQLMNA